jgi:hypothetical protein
VDLIGLNVIEDALVVRDDQRAHVGTDQAVDAVGDDAQRVDVEARVGLVKDRNLGLEHCHLQDLEALLLAAGEPVVERARGHRLIDLEQLHCLLDLLAKLGDADRVVDTVWSTLAVRVDGHANEVRNRYTRHGKGILEGEKQASARALIGSQVEQVGALEQHLALGHLVAGMSHQYVAEGRLARAIRAHDRVDLTLGHLQIDPLQDLCVGSGDVGVQVANNEIGHGCSWGIGRSDELRVCRLGNHSSLGVYAQTSAIRVDE